MSDALSLYLREATALRFDAARCNCGQWVAAWVKARTGRDPSAGWAGPMDFEVERLARAGMAGFPTTRAPKRGDVGLVLAPEPTAAICLGANWAALAPSGLAVAAWPVLEAWTLNA